MPRFFRCIPAGPKRSTWVHSGHSQLLRPVEEEEEEPPCRVLPPLPPREEVVVGVTTLVLVGPGRAGGGCRSEEYATESRAEGAECGGGRVKPAVTGSAAQGQLGGAGKAGAAEGPADGCVGRQGKGLSW